MGQPSNILKTVVLSLALVSFFGLAACEEEGAVEKAGKSVDETIGKIGDKLKKATE